MRPDSLVTHIIFKRFANKNVPTLCPVRYDIVHTRKTAQNSKSCSKQTREIRLPSIAWKILSSSVSWVLGAASKLTLNVPCRHPHMHDLYLS